MVIKTKRLSIVYRSINNQKIDKKWQKQQSVSDNSVEK